MIPVEVLGRQGYAAGDVTNDVREVSRKQTHSDIQGRGGTECGRGEKTEEEGRNERGTGASKQCLSIDLSISAGVCACVSAVPADSAHALSICSSRNERAPIMSQKPRHVVRGPGRGRCPQICSLRSPNVRATTVTQDVDRFWNDQEVKFNWKAGIKGTGSRSNLI